MKTQYGSNLSDTIHNIKPYIDKKLYQTNIKDEYIEARKNTLKLWYQFNFENLTQEKYFQKITQIQFSLPFSIKSFFQIWFKNFNPKYPFSNPSAVNINLKYKIVLCSIWCAEYISYFCNESDDIPTNFHSFPWSKFLNKFNINRYIRIPFYEITSQIHQTYVKQSNELFFS